MISSLVDLCIGVLFLSDFGRCDSHPAAVSTSSHGTLRPSILSSPYTLLGGSSQKHDLGFTSGVGYLVTCLHTSKACQNHRGDPSFTEINIPPVTAEAQPTHPPFRSPLHYCGAPVYITRAYPLFQAAHNPPPLPLCALSVVHLPVCPPFRRRMNMGSSLSSSTRTRCECCLRSTAGRRGETSRSRLSTCSGRTAGDT